MSREELIARLHELLKAISGHSWLIGRITTGKATATIEAALTALQSREEVVLTDRDKSQIALADHEIRKSGEWMVNLIDTNLDATCTKEFDMIHTLRHSLRDLYRIIKLLEPK